MRADTNPVGFRLRSARGHLDGVIRMVEDDRYCIDVVRQDGSIGWVRHYAEMFVPSEARFSEFDAAIES